MSYKNLRITGIPAPLPVDYDRQVNFTDFEILNPGEPPRGVDLDAEFNAVQQGLDETQDRLGLIQRDDGALKNQSVGLDQLKTEAKIGVNTPDDWAPFTQYATNDSVIVGGGAWYIALVSHVSSGDFNDDLAAGNWDELLNLVPYTVEAKNWAAYPEDQLVPEGNGSQYSALHYSAKADDAQQASEAAQSASELAQTAAEQAQSLSEQAQFDAEQAEQGATSARDTTLGYRDTTLTALETFQDQWWGAYASEPATDPNGNGPNLGDIYFNTTTDGLYVYEGPGTGWRQVTASVERTSTTGSAVMPTGTTAERDSSPNAGYLRFNLDTGLFEGWSGSGWVPVGSGATGSSGDQVFVENDQLVTADYTIPPTKNAMSTGPVSIADGVTVTVSDGARWVII